MKVICKTVAGASADVEVEPTDTLAELKVESFAVSMRLMYLMFSVFQHLKVHFDIDIHYSDCDGLLLVNRRRLKQQCQRWVVLSAR